MLALYVELTYYLKMTKIELIKVKKKLTKLPIHIVRNLQRWALQVESVGIDRVRKISGYHDEPLKGRRFGQRSIRLSKSYRAIYVEYDRHKIHIVSVEEVSKHDY
jgi:proteic killer suppression protein